MSNPNPRETVCGSTTSPRYAGWRASLWKSPLRDGIPTYADGRQVEQPAIWQPEKWATALGAKVAQGSVSSSRSTPAYATWPTGSPSSTFRITACRPRCEWWRA